jgi:hypothetical protein
MMMTATQRKKGSGQNPVLLQNILPARSLVSISVYLVIIIDTSFAHILTLSSFYTPQREVIRNQKSIRRKARKGDINL